MKSDKLDMVLNEIFSEPVYPSEELVKATKLVLKRQGVLRYVIALSMAFNIIATFIFIYFMLFDLHNILEKIILFIIVSIVQNGIILVVYLYKEDIRDIFIKIQTNSI